MSTRFHAIDPVKLQDTIGNILALEVGIGNILEAAETIDDDLNIMTVQELDDFMNQDSTPMNVDVLLAVKKCLKNLLGMELENNTRLIVKNKNFFKDIHTVLNLAPKEDLVNYLLFGQMQKLTPYTTSNMRNLKNRFKLIIGQPSATPPRFTLISRLY